MQLEIDLDMHTGRYAEKYVDKQTGVSTLLSEAPGKTVLSLKSYVTDIPVTDHVTGDVIDLLVWWGWLWC